MAWHGRSHQASRQMFSYNQESRAITNLMQRASAALASRLFFSEAAIPAGKSGLTLSVARRCATAPPPQLSNKAAPRLLRSDKAGLPCDWAIARALQTLRAEQAQPSSHRSPLARKRWQPPLARKRWPWHEAETANPRPTASLQAPAGRTLCRRGRSMAGPSSGLPPW